ncbi:MAG: hypothetical protein P8X96_02110 [Desulfobacteraceae bacterium]
MDSDRLIQMENMAPIRSLLEELRSGLSSYWITAEEILRESGIRLKVQDKEMFSFKKNFFSFLFLYSFRKAGIEKKMRSGFAR